MLPGRDIDEATFPQVHGILQRRGIKDIFRPRAPIAEEIGSCANDLTAARLIIRLSADNGTIRRHSACTGFADSPEGRLEGRQSSRHRGCAFRATADRQNAVSLPPHSALHATERKDHSTGEGLAFDLRDRQAAARLSDASAHCERWPPISTDSPSAHMIQRTTIADLLAAASARMWEREPPVRLILG
ncbi:hypothetical protein A6U98_31700 [Rhizobium sp. WYCCWR10014]|nr:hypothetical protein A6U98_31700 [Rhizobium sp. WYCCWR10014]